jgi:hypothetical protein
MPPAGAAKCMAAPRCRRGTVLHTQLRTTRRTRSGHGVGATLSLSVGPVGPRAALHWRTRLRAAGRPAVFHSRRGQRRRSTTGIPRVMLSGGCGRTAEAEVELHSLVPPAASANYDAAFTAERFKLLALVAEAPGGNSSSTRCGKSHSFICSVSRTCDGSSAPVFPFL